MREEEKSSQVIQKRVQRVQADIIGNEALGGDALDESGASELLSFGLKSAEGIVSTTEGMDDETAELSIADRLKALRKLLRHLGRLLGEGLDMDADGRLWLWNSVQTQARSLYGDHLEFPDVDIVMERLVQGESPGQIITSLRSLFESQSDGQRGN